MSAVEKVVINSNIDPRMSSLPKEALEVMAILDNLENFTIELRRKISEEIRSSSKLIHVKLDSI